MNTESAAPSTRVALRLAALAVVVLLILAAMLSALGASIASETLGSVFFGWTGFLARVLPRVTVSRAGFATGILCLVLFTAGLHAFLRWLHREIRGGPGRWKPRWTASIVSVIVLMFASGIAMVAMTHQAGWLLAGKGRLVVERWQPSYGGGHWRSEDNLKMIGLGIHNYHSSHDALPANEGSLQSWQTKILPYLPFIIDEIDVRLAWDAPANSAAFRGFVPYYLSPGGTSLRDRRGYALSYYAGNRHIFGRQGPVRFGDFQDGLSGTMIVGELATGLKPWGDPTNLRDPSRPFDGSPEAFGSPKGGGANVLMMDGSVRFVSDRADPKVLRAMSGLP